MFRNIHLDEKMATVHSLISRFKKADVSDYPDVTKYERALDAGLWVLWIYRDKLRLDDYLTASEISQILRELGVAFKEIEIVRAFARADKKIDSVSVKGKPAYKIMKKGVEHLSGLAGRGNIEVIYVEGDKPRTSRQMLRDVVLKTKGEIRIVDKYYSRESLDMLEKLDHKRKIKFLTATLGHNESESKFKRELKTFKAEYKNIELGKYPREYELHDRYIVTNDSLILLGHGIKDLGSKESFVLVFKEKVGKEIRDSLSSKFDERWKKAQKL